jgi:TctA family transporter
MGPLARAVREIVAVARAETTTHRHLRERIVALFALSVVVNVVCGVLIFLFERHAPRTDIKTIGSGLFFSSAQLLSVSSSMTNPLTAAGRILDVGMEAYAITVVAALAGSFGAFFHRRSSERERAEGGAAR